MNRSDSSTAPAAIVDLAARWAPRVLALHAGRRPGERVMIGIVGAPGSGKSTLAKALVDALTEALPGLVGYLPMDGFHLADVQLARLGLSHRKGAPATFDAEGYVGLLERLRRNTDPVVYAPAFERDLEQPIAGALAIGREVEVVVTEGNYLLMDGPWARVPPLLDEIWFVRPDDDLRRRRLHTRHVRFGKSPEQATAWMATNDELNAAQVALTAARADLLIET